MRVFGTQDLAVDAACRFLDEGSDNKIEVGPMVGPREGNVLNAHDLRRLYESRETHTPQPFRRRSPAKVRYLRVPSPVARRRQGRRSYP
jgi:hypothetical protein